MFDHRPASTARPAPRHSSASVTDERPEPSARCGVCEQRLHRCSTTAGTEILVDPIPRFGGHLVVNPHNSLIVAVLPPGRRREVAYCAHCAVCPAGLSPDPAA